MTIIYLSNIGPGCFTRPVRIIKYLPRCNIQYLVIHSSIGNYLVFVQWILIKIRVLFLSYQRNKQGEGRWWPTVYWARSRNVNKTYDYFRIPRKVYIYDKNTNNSCCKREDDGPKKSNFKQVTNSEIPYNITSI